MVLDAKKIVALLFKVTMMSAFLLSDLYYAGVGRIFDYVSVILLLFLLNGVSIKVISSFFLLRALPLFIIAGVGIGIGLLTGAIPISLGLIVGILFILPISQTLVVHYERTLLESTIYLILGLSMFFFYYQFFMFYIFGTYVDLSEALGSISSRGNNENLGFFRAHGIFQEPNQYCSAMFCLLVICKFFSKRKRIVENLACLSMILSLSLWGIVGAFILLLALNSPFRHKNLLIALSLIFSFFLYFSTADLQNLSENYITVDRFINLQEDASYEGRVGALGNITWNFQFLLGSGVSSTLWQNRYGANSISFLLFSFGFISVSLMLIFLGWVTKFSIWSILALSYLFVTFPLFSYAYFWIWLGILIGLARERKSVSRSPFEVSY